MTCTRNPHEPGPADPGDDPLGLRRWGCDILVPDHDERGDPDPPELVVDAGPLDHAVDRAPDVAPPRHHRDMPLHLGPPARVAEDRRTEHDRTDPARDDPRPERTAD